MSHLSFSEWLRANVIIHAACLMGMIGVSVVTFFFVLPPVPSSGYNFPLIGGMVLVLATMAAFIISKKILESAKNNLEDLGEKLQAFRRAFIIRIALIEGAMLINLVLFYFVSGVPILRVFSLISILIFATQFATRERVVRALDLSQNEQLQLDDPNFKIAIME